MSADVASLMSNMVSDLWSQQSEAVVKVQFTYASDDTAKAATLGALESDGARIQRLDEVLKPEVLDGSFTFDKWAAIAKTVHDDINYQSGLSDSWAWTSVVSGAIAQTATDVVTDVKSTAKEVAEVAPYALGGTALILWAIAIIYVAYVYRSATA